MMLGPPRTWTSLGVMADALLYRVVLVRYA